MLGVLQCPPLMGNCSSSAAAVLYFACFAKKETAAGGLRVLGGHEKKKDYDFLRREPTTDDPNGDFCQGENKNTFSLLPFFVLAEKLKICSQSLLYFLNNGSCC